MAVDGAPPGEGARVTAQPGRRYPAKENLPPAPPGWVWPMAELSNWRDYHVINAQAHGHTVVTN
jgi:hypothetical protein